MLAHSPHQTKEMANEPAKTAVLIALVTGNQPLAKAEEYLLELASLADTWGLTVVKKFIQKLPHPHNATFVGKGKVAEIAAFIKAEHIGYAIFDDELSFAQVRNLESALSCCILDRNLLILNIFAMRAQTKQAKAQVELAQYQYLLPRLVRMWTHLSSQKGGSAGMRGPGEKELETDKRIIQYKINCLRKKLAHIAQQSITRSKLRSKLIRVALIGYTNVGKSTIMRLLSKASVLADDKPFATVDTTVRKVVLQEHVFLLADTVGFIRKLPHTLIACFKSTLTEIKEADLLLHVVDASYPDFQEQINIVKGTLAEIGAAAIPAMFVFNKIDAIDQPVQNNTHDTVQAMVTPMDVALRALEGQYKDTAAVLPTVFISVLQQWNVAILKEAIAKAVAHVQQNRYVPSSF
ncbi:GTPase HflX [Candidatus Cardinium hertigii]|uniref:GTPase HflX n=1 Tax=Candidatus Cardinium hertigii TaxID=247481 RepID=A0A2Z3LJN8_9BACT|nr:GTPase HflX [Candidatus Cardinium hertigii]AWN82250.1 GTPase HflX [Candidatus Cardinium hertigii]